MNQTLNEAINLVVLDDVQRLNQQFIKVAIKVWDAGQISGVPFCWWIQMSVKQQWKEMRARN